MPTPAPAALPRSFVIRLPRFFVICLYRVDAGHPLQMAGTVEDVEGGWSRGFRSATELLALLRTAKAIQAKSSAAS